MLMYARTLVPRPRDQASRMSELATIWQTVAAGAAAAASATEGAVRHINRDNDGPATQAFVSASSGPTSAPGGLEILSEAATRTANAHTAAAAATAGGLSAMDSVCWTAELDYAKAVAVPVIGRHLAAKVVWDTRQKLNALQDQTKAELANIYSVIQLPDPLVEESNRGESYGTVPQELADAWDDLTDDEKRRVLQAIADEYALANGMQPTPIVWESDANGHWDPNTGRLHINPDHINDPEVLHTAIHEAQHGLQFTMIDQYSNLSDADRQAIANGTMPDPFAQYGSNITEAERLNDNWGDRGSGYHVYEGGDAQSDSWRYYYYQPFEHDARRAGTEFVDGLTPEDLQDYL